MIHAASANRPWLRFRLRTVLLLVTIIALGVAQFATSRRVVELEARHRATTEENVRLRAEAGYLHIADPGRIVVLHLKDSELLTWHWKVWLPAGKWKLNALTQGIPPQGLPNAASEGPVDGAREWYVTVNIHKGIDGQWYFRAILAQAQIRYALPASHRLVERKGVFSSSGEMAGFPQQQEFEPDQPAVLIRLRAHQRVNSVAGFQTKEDPHGSDGVLVWIDRAP
jgi:hypothetical protein